MFKVRKNLVIYFLLVMWIITIIFSIDRIKYERDLQVSYVTVFNGQLFIPNRFYLFLEKSEFNELIFRDSESNGTIYIRLKGEMSPKYFDDLSNQALTESKLYGLTHLYLKKNNKSFHIFYDDFFVLFFNAGITPFFRKHNL